GEFEILLGEQNGDALLAQARDHAGKPAHDELREALARLPGTPYSRAGCERTPHPDLPTASACKPRALRPDAPARRPGCVTDGSAVGDTSTQGPAVGFVEWNAFQAAPFSPTTKASPLPANEMPYRATFCVSGTGETSLQVCPASRVL